MALFLIDSLRDCCLNSTPSSISAECYVHSTKAVAVQGHLDIQILIKSSNCSFNLWIAL
jgi:hypothetical protein